MFNTCIHCASHLGRNEALERFPVGQRLAYDPAKGRLWVVCKACERWNLSPLEERWEAIEDAERRYRDSRLRVSTDNIGLARLREGLDLIRIGDPQRPEMAAWRYGDQFGRRRRRQLLITGTVVGSAAAVVGGVLWVGASFASFAGVYGNAGIWDSLIHGRPGKLVARVRGPGGETLYVQRRHARMTVIERVSSDEALRLRLEHEKGTTILQGPDAERAAQQLLPTVNRFGGSAKRVQEAVSLLESVGDPRGVLTRLHRTHGATESDAKWKRGTWGHQVTKVAGALHTLPVHERLAFEMALHEETERRAMDGELEALERAWREAEEIAGIADAMFVPAAVDAEVERLKLRRTHESNAAPPASER